MRILFLNYEYPPLGGGAANATSYILREFSEIPDLQVDLVTSSPSEKYEEEKIGDNVIIHKLPIGKNNHNLHYQSQKDLIVYAWKAYWFSRKLIKRNKYNLTHSFFSVPCGFLSFIFRCQYKLPYIISLRGADVPGYSERFSWLYKIITPLISLIWKEAVFVVANSHGLKELALKTNQNQKIEIIFNGIDTDKFKPEETVKIPGKFIITPGASRITARKGLNYLIEAVAKLSSRYPQVHLEIMGEGNEKENLENLVQNLKLNEKVDFLGRIDKDETYKFYQRADLFVLPSLNEGMSNAMLEALSSGLPILATDTGGTRELVREGENGFIIKMKDAADIAEKMEKFIKDKELLNRMGEKSRKKALELSWQQVAGEYYALYKKINRNF